MSTSRAIEARIATTATSPIADVTAKESPVEAFISASRPADIVAVMAATTKSWLAVTVERERPAPGRTSSAVTIGNTPSAATKIAMRTSNIDPRLPVAARPATQTAEAIRPPATSTMPRMTRIATHVRFGALAWKSVFTSDPSPTSAPSACTP